MTLDALQHLIRAASSLAEDTTFLVLGSASLLASSPDLGAPGAPLASTYDADILPEPFDELTGTMLDEALGEQRAYYRRHGYHADILRESILETLPLGWRERLVPVPETENALALEPHDLAAVKLFVGRPKDLELVTALAQSGMLAAETVRARLDGISKADRDIPRCTANFRTVFPT